MKKKKVILSYDYELFFGEKSGTVKKSLVDPTDKILDAMETVGLCGNFFIDVLMIKFLQQNTDQRSKEDLTLIEDQLRDIVRRGHRIELHLHPHWVDAKYNGDGTWDFSNFRHYMLSTFPKDEIIQMFIDGVGYLNSIGSEVKPGYRVCAFRAGGWSIQPFEKLKEAFQTAGIFVDSSTAYGLFGKNQYSWFDFRNIPNKWRYHFEDDVCIEDRDGRFIEIKISSRRISLFFRIITKIIRQNSNVFLRLTDGTHKRNDLHVAAPSGLKAKISDILNTRRMYSFSNNYKYFLLISILLNNNVCIIDHPKDLCKSTIDGIQLIGRFCKSELYINLKDFKE